MHPTYTSPYNQLVLRQTQVGWHQLLLGRFVTDWADLQDDHISPHSIANKKARTGSQWVVQVIDFLWDYIIKD